MAAGEIGTRIRRAREIKRWKQRDLAEALGVGLRTVGSWERGESVPRSSIGAIEAVLGISLTADRDDDWYDQDDPIERGIAEALPSPDARKFIAQLRAARMEHVPRAHEPPA